MNIMNIYLQFILAVTYMVLSYQIIAFKYRKSRHFSGLSSTLRVLFVSLHVFIVISNIIIYFNLISKDFNPGIYSIAGLMLFVFGISMIFWVIYFLKKATFIPENKLFTNGPFNIVRHPMYFGGITGAIGLAIYAGSLPAFLYSIALVLMLNHISNAEEDDLKIRFGIEYEKYVKKVPKLFPYAW